jgi:CRP/FNR family transcriptional regulator
VAKILLQSIGPDEGVGAGSDQRARLTQREIAEMAGTAREVVARTLKVFEREGAIAVDQGRITILDPAQLESMI